MMSSIMMSLIATKLVVVLARLSNGSSIISDDHSSHYEYGDPFTIEAESRS